MASDETARGIGIIGGTGWLGAAIARALLTSNFVDPDGLWISNRSGRRDGFEAWPDVNFTTDNQELVDACSTVLLSVLPQDFGGVAVDARGHLVISVMAGVPVEVIARCTGSERIVRALPNAAAEILRQDRQQHHRTGIHQFLVVGGEPDVGPRLEAVSPPRPVRYPQGIGVNEVRR